MSDTQRQMLADIPDTGGSGDAPAEVTRKMRHLVALLTVGLNIIGCGTANRSPAVEESMGSRAEVPVRDVDFGPELGPRFYCADLPLRGADSCVWSDSQLGPFQGTWRYQGPNGEETFGSLRIGGCAVTVRFGDQSDVVAAGCVATAGQQGLISMPLVPAAGSALTGSCWPRAWRLTLVPSERSDVLTLRDAVGRVETYRRISDSELTESEMDMGRCHAGAVRGLPEWMLSHGLEVLRDVARLELGATAGIDLLPEATRRVWAFLAAAAPGGQPWAEAGDPQRFGLRSALDRVRELGGSLEAIMEEPSLRDHQVVRALRSELERGQPDPG